MHEVELAKYLIPGIVLVFIVAIAMTGIYRSRIWDYLRLKKELDAGCAALKEVGNDFGGRAFNQLDEDFTRNDLLAGPWREFTETVIQDETIEPIRIWNTQQADLFFSFDRLVVPRISLSLLDAIPGIITGVGLLGTFWAIYSGLGELHVTASKSVDGIDGLINNLSAKFLSSIIGVGSAVLFMAVEKLCVQSLEKRCHEIESRINELFPRLVPEKLLFDMLTQSRVQTRQLTDFNSDMSSRLKSSLEESMQPTMNRMIDAITELTKMTDGFHRKNQPTSEQIVASLERLTQVTEKHQTERGEQNTSALENMAAMVSEKLSSGANAEIANLSNVLASAGDTISKMTEKMEQSMGAMESELHSQQREAQVQRDALTNSVMEIINRLDSHTSNHMTQVQNSNSEVAQRMEQHLNESFESYKRQQIEQLEISQAQYQQFRETADRLLQGMTGSASEQSVRLEELTQSVIAKLNESAESLTSNLRETATSSSEQAASLITANESLKETVGSVMGLLSGNREMLSQWSDATSRLNQLTVALEKSSSQMEGAQKLSHDAFLEISKQLTRYEQDMKTTENLWAQQKELHQWLDGNIGKLLAEVNQAMIHFENHTKDTLGKSLTSFDESLSDAVSKLAGTVENLDDKLVDLTDVFEKPLARASR